MRPQNVLRTFASPLVVLALLMMATAAAGLWHHHGCTSNSNCLACQVVHQTVGPAQPSLGFSSPKLVLWNHTPEEFVFCGVPILRSTSTRSPPLV
jgi:hypothetical protein